MWLLHGSECGDEWRQGDEGSSSQWQWHQQCKDKRIDGAMVVDSMVVGGGRVQE